MIELRDTAARKLGSIEQSAGDATALVASLIGRLNELRNVLLLRERELACLSEDDPKRPAIAAEVKRLSSEIESLTETQKRRQDRRDNDAQVAVQCRRWLESLPRDAVLTAVPVAPLEDVADIPGTLAALRQRIDNLKAERRNVKGAALVGTVLKQRARDLVAELAAQGCPKIDLYGGKLEVFAEQDSPRASIRDVASMIAWAMPDAVLSALQREIEARVPDGAMSEQSRLRKLGKLDAEILELERHEEQLIETALTRGQDVYRRPNANAAAILGVDVAKRRKRAA